MGSRRSKREAFIVITVASLFKLLDGFRPKYQEVSREYINSSDYPDPHRSFKSQLRCQNPPSGSLNGRRSLSLSFRFSAPLLIVVMSRAWIT